MKSSYKLYGTFWDKRPIPERALSICCKFNEISENTIHLSEILENEAPVEYQFLDGKPIELLLDYFPSVTSSVIVEFFVKRILQIADYYDVTIVRCNSQNEVDIIERIIADFDKRKTPDKLLAQSYGAFQMIC